MREALGVLICLMGASIPVAAVVVYYWEQPNRFGDGNALALATMFSTVVWIAAGVIIAYSGGSPGGATSLVDTDEDDDEEED
ncbi:hypothetical protein M0R72_10535 [Candidatus Pacearchaeota archaeon]|jgi:hypothetical protein|nr:hypothetical protein [Candidatus Pacearchaeota archaeon]